MSSAANCWGCYDAAMTQQWIQSAEYTPQPYIRVLAFVPCQPHEHAHCIASVDMAGRWELGEPYDAATEPSHWMPLPCDPL
jgi:hypothetical protein